MNKVNFAGFSLAFLWGILNKVYIVVLIPILRIIEFFYIKARFYNYIEKLDITLKTYASSLAFVERIYMMDLFKKVPVLTNRIKIYQYMISKSAFNIFDYLLLIAIELIIICVLLYCGINGNDYYHSIEYGYANTKLTDVSEFIGQVEYKSSYFYDNEGRVNKIAFGESDEVRKEVHFDPLGRNIRNQIITNNGVNDKNILTFDFGFTQVDTNRTSDQINNYFIIANSDPSGYVNHKSYVYDSRGNISNIYGDITKNAGVEFSDVQYIYDAMNQLTRVDDNRNNKTTTYTYDVGGNIIEINEYDYTKFSIYYYSPLGTPNKTITYEYGDLNWKDKLTKYDGQTITYDSIGNPLTFGNMTFAWEAGRQLKSMTKDANNISYTYNNSGIRTSKTVNGTTTNYTLVDNKVTYEEDGTNEIYYRYDNEGKLLSMNLNGSDYFYMRNIQGDIEGLVDESGSLVVEYMYGAWGELLEISGSLKDTVDIIHQV